MPEGRFVTGRKDSRPPSSDAFDKATRQGADARSKGEPDEPERALRATPRFTT